MPTAIVWLISATSGAISSTRVIIWSVVLLAFLIVGLLVITAIKKRMRDDEPQQPGAAAGFTLSDLRQLHREGQLSNEEFDRAKAKIVAAARKANERDANTKPPGGAGLPGL